MNINILLIVLLDYLKMKEEYIDLDEFLQDNYHDEFIRDFFIEYDKLNTKVMIERSTSVQSNKQQKQQSDRPSNNRRDCSKQNEVNFEYI